MDSDELEPVRPQVPLVVEPAVSPRAAGGLAWAASVVYRYHRRAATYPRESLDCGRHGGDALTYYPILRTAAARNIMGNHVNSRVVTILAIVFVTLIMLAPAVCSAHDSNDDEHCPSFPPSVPQSFLMSDRRNMQV